MPTEDIPGRFSSEIGECFGDASTIAAPKGLSVTSRGSKYWSSGSIPAVAPEVLGDVLAFASDLSVVILESGQIQSVLANADHASFPGVDNWTGQDIRETLTTESIAKLDDRLQALKTGPASHTSVELNHVCGSGSQFPIRYSLHQTGVDGTILLLGHDLRPIAEIQQQLVKAQIAVEQDREAQREIRTCLKVVLESSNEAFLFVNQSSGRILDLNGLCATYLGADAETLNGRDLAAELGQVRRRDIVSELAAQAISETHKPIKVTARRSKRNLRITSTAFRAAGQRMLLCKLVTEDELGAEDALIENLSAFYQEGVEAIVFTDENGIIQSANESFLDFLDASHLTRLKSRSISDFFARGTVDLKVLTENARRVGQMRIYATSLISEYGNRLPVEISATWLNDRAHPSVVFVIRDTSRVEAIRRPGQSVAEQGVAGVMDLIGSASLKEIVTDTTDVVEKMCIETAVELTRNNRVAAAEMLGLSRQSLYVKLRKYGILNRDS